MKPFFVYMLRCSDGSFYIGHTDDLEKRFFEHQTGVCESYTVERRPVTLVFSEQCQTRYEALSLERQLKGWSRAKKQALVEGDFQKLKELSRSSASKAKGVR